MTSAYAWFGRHHVIMAVPLRVYYLRAKAGYLRRPSQQQGAFVGGENVQLHKRVLASVGLASGVPGAVCGPARVSRPDVASGEELACVVMWRISYVMAGCAQHAARGNDDAVQKSSFA